MTRTRRSVFAALAATATLSLAACGGGASAGSSSTGTMSPSMSSSDPSMSSSSSMSSSDSMSSSPSTSSSAMAGSLVGPGCAAYAAKVPSGAGSVAGMAQDPVATAASNNPLLTTLVAAVSGKLNPKVNLVDTLNSGQFTVFAPVDSAFAKVDSATLAKLKSDPALLTKVLTYHVVQGQISPDMIDGTHATVEGQDLTVTGSGDSLKVNDANVICGGVKTANATVYLIDGVLTPPAK